MKTDFLIYYFFIILEKLKTGMERCKVDLGSRRVRRRTWTHGSVWAHLVAGYRSLQQVNIKVELTTFSRLDICTSSSQVISVGHKLDLITHTNPLRWWKLWPCFQALKKKNYTYRVFSFFFTNWKHINNVVQRAFTLLFFLSFFLYYSLMLDSADGEYAVTTMTKAILHSDGHVKW